MPNFSQIARSLLVAGAALLWVPSTQAVNVWTLVDACRGEKNPSRPLDEALEEMAKPHLNPIQVWQRLMEALKHTRGDRKISETQLQVLNRFILRNAAPLAQLFDAEKKDPQRREEVMGTTLSRSIYSFYQWIYFLDEDRSGETPPETKSEIQKLKESWLSVLMWHPQVTASYWSSEFVLEMKHTFPISKADPHTLLKSPDEKSEGHFAYGLREVVALIERIGPYLHENFYVLLAVHMSRTYPAPVSDREMRELIARARLPFRDPRQADHILMLFR